MYPPFRILLVIAKPELRMQLNTILSSAKYVVETENTAKAARLKIEEQHFDLVICQQTLPDKPGFRFFKMLEEQLYQYNTGFFLIIEDYTIEDVQLGLEVGVDNFIFSPISPSSLINKVEKRLQKASQFNFYGTQRFRMQFHSSPMPMFYSENQNITEVNESFSRLFEVRNTEQEKTDFFDLFHLNGDQQNHLKLRKLENGLIDYCWLQDVQSVRPKMKFNLYKSVVGNRDKNRILTIIVPTCRHNSDESLPDECPILGTCMKSNKRRDEQVEDIQLTPRELEVFKLSAGGIPIKQIAAHLDLSERTIEKHRSNIMKKTNTHSMMEAVLRIQRQQILL
ncbi:LuxR C-terminal-related transcriptional regulator [Draconibacterium sp. IB214405]|uniref:LuxR C-terminal-related transcriptional regulator n=1 Tax=Draconibacterium sp. IB214405 TaxID=3097352 RepID=UPI002A0B0F80|nr:LuxR C-terminal-related transcriptional regulator [Draconibacterium sp. IB214405]MDX8339494.1 LuxR C-terminal-related transcriptional regulator [Draconibacterium sp. IB214405]